MESYSMNYMTPANHDPISTPEDWNSIFAEGWHGTKAADWALHYMLANFRADIGFIEELEKRHRLVFRLRGRKCQQ